MPARPRPVSIAVPRSSDPPPSTRVSRRVSVGHHAPTTSSRVADTTTPARVLSTIRPQTPKPPDPRPLSRDAASDADVLLQSEDGTLLYAHQWLLARASRVFAKMLANLNQPSSAITASTQSTGPPILIMTESTRALRLLLGMIYPACLLSEPPSLPLSRDDTYMLAQLARKYSAAHLTEAARRGLLAYVPKDPTWAFAAAWVFEFADVARAAAVESLRHDFLPSTDIKILRQVPAATLGALQDFRRRCARTAASALARVAELEREAQTGRCRMVTGRPNLSFHRRQRGSGNEGKTCLLAYVDAVALRLADYPHPRTVVDSHDLLLQTCLSAGSAPCASCSERAQMLLKTKMEELRTRLEMELATVPLQLPF
ncbi:hypothetical protein PENSPDRAFT_653385 [Peniophora sp. CONT]|nr:hypothetical protein PENSPDRAFT_653385 [Peniophora sp. CONT]